MNGIGAALCVSVLVALSVAVPAAAARGPGSGDWNPEDQRAVVDTGLMLLAPDGRFHGERALSAAALRDALAALASTLELAPVRVPQARVTVKRFSALLVRQLGFSDIAARFHAEAHRAGLGPPRQFGFEAVARLLELRPNHRDERLELNPWDTITRAEAAYMLARVERLGRYARQDLEEAVGRFVLPRYTARQRAVLRVAVAKIGKPFVWGGETDDRRGYDTRQARGGYDCSGFIWRAFRLSGQPARRRQFGGRTAAQMAGKIGRASRIPRGRIRPGDLLFFGDAYFRDRATEKSITHSAIALSRNYMIQSSYQGVNIAPFAERAHQFAWARRVL